MRRSVIHVPFIATLAALATAALPAGAQDFEGSVTYRTTVQGRSFDMVHRIRGTEFRVELDAMGQTFVMLTDAQAERQIALMPAERQWMDMKAMQERMAALMGSAGRGMGQPDQPAEDFALTPTGQTETIAGYECQHYALTAGDMEADICAATDVGWRVWSPQAVSNMAGMAGGGRGMGGMPGMGGPPTGLSPEQLQDLEETFQNGFFPLRITFSDGPTTGTMEVIAVEEGELDPALFEIPEGYTEMRMPGPD